MYPQSQAQPRCTTLNIANRCVRTSLGVTAIDQEMSGRSLRAALHAAFTRGVGPIIRHIAKPRLDRACTERIQGASWVEGGGFNGAIIKHMAIINYGKNETRIEPLD